jgi:RHS repeat-associated protein
MPFGDMMDGRITTSSAGTNEKFTGHEFDDEVNLYYMQWRRYIPRFGVFTGVDPLASARPGLTPYNYVQNNPIIRIDPTGLLDDYALNRQTGENTLIRETDDDFDVLYATDNQGNVDENTSIKVNDQSILPQLAQERNDFSVRWTRDSIFPGRLANTNNRTDAFNVFKFTAENSNVEWSYQRFTDGSLSIATANKDWITATGRTHASNAHKTVAVDIHSHPVSSGRDLLPSGNDYARARYFHRQNPNVKVQLYVPQHPDPRRRWVDIVNNRYID